MKQIFIGASVAYTAAVTPNLLTPGEIGIFNAENNALITAATAANFKGLPFFIAAGSSVGPRVGNPIHWIKEYDANVYAAPVKEVVTVSNIVKATVSDKYTEYSVKVIDVTLGMSPWEGKITYSVLGNFADAAAIVDALVLKINGNPDSIVVASKTGSDLTLTAKKFLVNFRVALGGELELATVTYTTPMSVGIGYGPRVNKLENDFLVYEGHRARLDRRYPQPPLQSSAAANYDIISLEGIYTANQKDGMNALYNRNTLYMMAIVAGGAQYATINTILTGLRTVGAGTTETESPAPEGGSGEPEGGPAPASVTASKK